MLSPYSGSNRRRGRLLAFEPLDERNLLACATDEVCECYGGACDSESYGGTEAYIGECDEYGGDAYGGECQLVTENAQIVETVSMMNDGTDQEGNIEWIITLTIKDGYNAADLDIELSGAFEDQSINQRIDGSETILIQVFAPPTLSGEALFIVTDDSAQESDFVWMLL